MVDRILKQGWRTFFSLVVGSCGCTLLLTACDRSPSSAPSSPSAPTSAAASDTLKLLYWQAPTILNPHLSIGLKDLEASRLTLEPLASYNNQGELVLFLAAEVPTAANGGLAADGKSVTWKLKPGVKWSDGQPFTAADVVFTHQFLTNPAVGAISAATYDTIERVEAIDDTTVKISFKDVNPG